MHTSRWASEILSWENSSIPVLQNVLPSFFQEIYDWTMQINDEFFRLNSETVRAPKIDRLKAISTIRGPDQGIGPKFTLKTK